AIYAARGALGGRADSVTVADCIVDGLTVGSMAYGAGKSRAEEDVGQVRVLSYAAIVYHNVITNGFNGLELGSGDPVRGLADSTVGSRCEVSYNTIAHVADDAIELDTSHMINTLLLGNTIIDAGHGISMVPIYTGPLFAFYNTIGDSRAGGLKVGGTLGISWFAHNPIVSGTGGAWAIDGGSSGPVENMHFRNNVFGARGVKSGYTLWGTSSASRFTNDFNYDLIDSAFTARLVYWGGFEYSLPQLQSQLHWERNGLTAAPMFSDSANKNWSLSPSRRARARAHRIPGANTSLDGPLYSSGAPDIGAKSLRPVTAAPPPGGPPPRFLARAAPNPARGDAVIVYALPAEALV